MDSKTPLNRPVRFILLIAILVFLTTSELTIAKSKNGFDLSNTLVPQEEILHGGPPKDGIPAIDNPKFVTAQESYRLAPGDRIIGVFINGVARAYPIRILNWHEVVNDKIGDDAFVVTFCPLCGTGIVFQSTTSQKPFLTFGVSGLLYNSDVLLYDRQTHSLWSQIAGMSVSGPLKGVKLNRIPAQHTTWKNWQKQYPNTKVLSFKTNVSRDYQHNPYQNYERSKQLYFPVSRRDNQYHYHPKERVIGIEIKGNYKAYPFIELEKQKQISFEDKIGTETITIKWQPEHRSGQVFDQKGEELASIISFWFAWFAFHPETEVYQAK